MSNEGVQVDWAEAEMSRLRAEGERDKAQTLLAAAQKAAKWLWGFWDGNTLVAKPGYEDDIKEAWGKLLMAVDSADDALIERPATLDAAKEALQHERALRQVAETGERAARETLARTETLLNASNAKLRKCQDRLDQACIELDAAESALAGCGIGGIFAKFDNLPDAINQMAQHIKELSSRLTQAQVDLDAEPIEVEITGKEMVEALQAERQLRQEAERVCKAMSEMARSRGKRLKKAEQRAKWLYSAMVKVHKALDRCKVRATYDDTHHIARAESRILWLCQRAERAETLAQLVTPELPALLYRLSSWNVARSTAPADRDAARDLAAEIREALDDSQA